MFIVHVAAGLLLIALAIPLILRRVPMNQLYGMRIARAFESDAAWYDINAYGGKLLFAYGVALVIYGIFARPFAPDPRSIWSLVYVLAPFVLVAPMLALIFRYANSRA